MTNSQKVVFNVKMELSLTHKILVNAFLVQNKDLYITLRNKLVKRAL